MATVRGISRLFTNLSINISKRTDVRTITTTKSLDYLTPSDPRKYKIKWYKKRGRSQYRTELPWFVDENSCQKEIIDTTEEDDKNVAEVTKEINSQIEKGKVGRLFAVVHLCGKQFKVTESDIIIIHGYWPPTTGDKLKLDKVLMVGSKDFTLIGQPIVDASIVSIDATVIEKTLSHTRIHFRMKKRKQFRRTHFLRAQHTKVRINEINLINKITEELPEKEVDVIY